jgi:hypothetical protein
VEPESSLGSVTTAAARIAIQSIRAELDLELEDLALVHRAVAVRHIVERTAAVEDAAGLDPPLEHVGQQPLDVGAYRCGPPPMLAVFDAGSSAQAPVAANGATERTIPRRTAHAPALGL